MKRIPSIHIREDILAELVGDKKAREISEYSRKYSCDNRIVSISNEKVKREIGKKLSSNKGDASLTSDILYSVRVELKHRGIKKIQENDRDWLQVKQLAKLLNQFCEEFNLQKREGYIKYIRIGLSKLQSMRMLVSKLISMYESICQEYESINEVMKDPSPDITKELHDIFTKKIADRTGLLESYIKNPAKYYYFYKAKLLCIELGIEPEVFIEAQFEALDFCKGLPSPEQLSSDKSRERVTKYLFEKGITSNKKEKEVKVKEDFWQSLKK